MDDSIKIGDGVVLDVHPKPVLKGSEICAIIKACKDANVSELKINEIHILFGENQPKLSQELKHDPRVSPAQIAEAQEAEATREIEKSEEEVKEDQVSELLLTDPEQYEDLMLSGELEETEHAG